MLSRSKSSISEETCRTTAVVGNQSDQLLVVDGANQSDTGRGRGKRQFERRWVKSINCRYTSIERSSRLESVLHSACNRRFAVYIATHISSWFGATLRRLSRAHRIKTRTNISNWVKIESVLVIVSSHEDRASLLTKAFFKSFVN